MAQTTQYVTRKARQVSRQARDWWAVDNDGVRNADFCYISKNDRNNDDHDRVIEVQAERIPRRGRRPTKRPPSPPSNVNNEPTWTSGRAVAGGG